MEIIYSRALIKQNSYNEENNTIDIVWTTGEKVLRNYPKLGKFYEELEVSETAIDLERLNRGANVLIDHSQSLNSVLGVVERAWIENGQGIATIKFSTRTEVQGFVEDIKNGIIKNLSTGYIVNSMKDISQKGDSIKTMKATRWTPYEISFVTIPADAKSQTRNQGVIEVESKEIEIETQDVKVAIEEERKRIEDIHLIARKFNMDQTHIDKFIKNGTPLDEVRQFVIENIKIPTINATSITTTSDSHERFMKGVEKGLLIRSGIEKDDTANEFRDLRLIQIAERCLQNSGQSISASYDTIVLRAFTSTSDFPLILSNVANKSLEKGFQEQPTTFEFWTQSVTVTDFKPNKIISMGEFANLQPIPELGEYQHNSLSDHVESLTAIPYGSMFGISRQTIINDDLNALSDIPNVFGRTARRTINAEVYKKLFSNPVMSDGVSCFHANHGNLGTGAPTVQNLDAIKTAMGMQQDHSKNAYLGIEPNIILCPRALRGTFNILMNSQFNPDVTGKFQIPNIVNGMCSVVSDPLLDANSATAYYLVSTYGRCFVVAYLNGIQTPVAESRNGWSTDGTEFKIRLDFGVGCIDSRLIYKSTGV